MTKNSGAEEILRARLLAYLQARREFESASWRQSSSSRGESHGAALDEIGARYQALLRAFVASDRIDGHPAGSWGNPPSVDPAETVLLSIKVAGQTAIVVTSEPSDPLLPPDTYEYEWRLEGGEWRLVDRSSLDRRRRRIRGLF